MNVSNCWKCVRKMIYKKNVRSLVIIFVTLFLSNVLIVYIIIQCETIEWPNIGIHLKK